MFCVLFKHKTAYELRIRDWSSYVCSSELASVQRVFALLALRVAEHGNEPLALPARGEVHFDGVGFAYGSHQVLTDFSLTIAAGASVALVGATGSGKSTALKLLLRFHQPDRGVIRFDGIDTRPLDPAALRRAIGYVAPEPFLTDGSEIRRASCREKECQNG